MGCYYWECKFNNNLQQGQIGDCGKLNDSNIRKGCPTSIPGGDFCERGEKRITTSENYCKEVK